MQGAAVATEIFQQRGALATPTRGKGKERLHLRNLTWIPNNMVCKKNYLLSKMPILGIGIYVEFWGG